jgi:hypothetical protein
MKQPLRATALALVALATSACATSSVQQVWRDPNYRPSPIKRVFVVAAVPNAQERVIFENAVAESFIKKGFEVATSGGILPPGNFENSMLVDYVKDMDVDLVVVLRLVAPYGTWTGATDFNVYAAKTSSEWPVWSGTTTTSNANSAQDAATSVAAALLYGLIKANVLVR